MTAWAKSRHPEWDQMYAAGIKPTEIAHHCHAQYATVRLHLQVREQYEPGLRATHEQAFDARPKQWANATWISYFEQVAHYVSETGAFPDVTRPETSKLGFWLGTQRSLEKTGKLTERKRQALNMLGDWKTTNAKRSRDKQWRERLTELVIYLETHKQIPRYKYHSSEEERRLGVWLHTQAQNQSNELLLPWRKEELDTRLGDWRARQ